MRRRSIQRLSGHRRRRGRNGVEPNGQHGKSDAYLNPPVLDRNVVQPHNPTFTVGDLGALVVVRFEVAMRYGARMIGVGFVDMLRRDHS